MAFTKTTAENILKENYQPPVRDLLNNRTVFLKKITKRRKGFQGKQAVVPLRVGRNVGVGPATTGADLPTPGNQQYNRAVYTAKQLYGAIELDGLAIRLAKSDVGSFVRGTHSEMVGLSRDLLNMMSRISFGDGSGMLTQCGVTSSATTVVVESTRFLQVGMKVDMAAMADGAAVTDGYNVTVATIPNATTFTVADAVTTAATDAVFVHNSRLHPSVTTPAGVWGNHHEPFGLQALVGTADPANGLTDDVGGIARSGNSWWQANEVDKSGAALTVDNMQEAYDQSEIELDTSTGLILTDHYWRRFYAALLVGNKRYVNTMKIDGGFTGIEFNDVPVVADKDAHIVNYPNVWDATDGYNRMYFLSMPSFEYEVVEDWGWLDEDGHVLKMKTGTGAARQDAWVGYMGAYVEFAVQTPRANTVLICDNAA
jgi:hypothetical protein